MRDDDSGDAVDADGAADPPRAARPTSPGMAGATAGSSMWRTASRSSCCSSCRSTDPIKISRLTIRNISGRAAAAVGHGLCRMGARPVARRVGADGRHRARRRDRRDLRAQSLEHASRRARGLRRPGRPPDRLDRRPQRVHRPQRHASTIRAALSGAIPLSQRVGAGLDPCAALQTTIELERGGTTEIVFFLGQAGDAAAGAGPDRALPRGRSRRRLSRGRRATGTRRWARCR